MKASEVFSSCPSRESTTLSVYSTLGIETVANVAGTSVKHLLRHGTLETGAELLPDFRRTVIGRLTEHVLLSTHNAALSTIISASHSKPAMLL